MKHLLLVALLFTSATSHAYMFLNCRGDSVLIRFNHTGILKSSEVSEGQIVAKYNRLVFKAESRPELKECSYYYQSSNEAVIRPTNTIRILKRPGLVTSLCKFGSTLIEYDNMEDLIEGRRLVNASQLKRNGVAISAQEFGVNDRACITSDFE